jgi:hypothetical protein
VNFDETPFLKQELDVLHSIRRSMLERGADAYPDLYEFTILSNLVERRILGIQDEISRREMLQDGLVPTSSPPES